MERNDALTISDMMRATPYVMDTLGYYAGGPCYDEDKPAYVAPLGTAYGVSDPTWLVVGHYDDYWFCEDSNGEATLTADTPEDALARWLETRDVPPLVQQMFEWIAEGNEGVFVPDLEEE